MGKLKTKVESVVAETFHDAIAELEEIPQLEKLSGHVIWQGFDGMPDRERQRKLWGALRDELTPQETNGLSLILTFTPAELSAMAGSN